VPRDSDDAPAGGVQRAVLGTVVLEGLRRSVYPAAVELDDEPLLVPDAVAFLAPASGGDPDVRLGAIERARIDEGQKRRLELAPGPARAFLTPLEDRGDGARP